MTETDLSANIPGFSHARIWRNAVTGKGNYDGPNGFNWDVAEWPYLVQRTYGGKTTINVRIGRLQIRFDESGGAYTARHTKKYRYTLTHDSGTNLFTLTRKTAGGVEIIEFHDFIQTTNPVGLMKQRTDPSGHVTQVTSYTSGGNINGLYTERGSEVFELAYSYISSGTHANRIEHVTLNKLDQYPSPTTTTPIRRVRYTYYDGTNSYGLANDLEAAIVQKPTGNPSPNDWEDIRVSYYRYYKTTINKGTGGVEHGLRYVLNPASYAEVRAAGQDALAGEPSGDDLVPDYADHFFEYDRSHRVTKEIARGCASCGSSGGTSNSGETFQRTKNPNYPSAASPSTDYLYNTWMTKTTSQVNAGYETIVYTNRVNRVMLKVKRELNTGGPIREWCTYFEYDDDGNEILRAMPSAVTGYDESLDDLVGQQSGGTYTYLRNNDGLIRLKSYYSSTTATDTTAGGVDGYMASTSIQEGSQGTAIKTGLTKYLASDNSSGEKTYVVGESESYPDTTNQDATKITTTYSYQWYAPSGSQGVRMKERVTTLPSIPVSQNGDGVSAVRREYFDDIGNLTWRQDERGIITKMEYDDLRNQLTQTTDDVDTVPNPPGWTVNPGSHFVYVTNYSYDDLGRQTLVQRPEHVAEVSTGTSDTIRAITNTLYVESAVSDQAVGDPQVSDEIRTASGYYSESASTYTLVDPISITLNDKRGRTLDRIVSARSTGSGLLAESDTFLRADWSSWSVMRYTAKGQQEYQRDYHNIPAQSPDQGLEGVNDDPGVSDTNYYESFYGYDADTNRRVRMKSPNGTITRTVYDNIERPIATYVGTDDTPSELSGSVARWPLTEETIDGTTGDDVSGFDDNITFNADPTLAMGPSGDIDGAARFNGTDDQATSGTINTTMNAYTVSLWAKAATNSQVQYTGLFSNKDDGGSNDSLQISFTGDASPKYQVLFSSNAVNIGTVETEWQHLVVTYDGATVRTYFNGSLANSLALTPANAGTYFRKYCLGSNRAQSAFFEGDISDARVYNRALSANEISQIHQDRTEDSSWESWTPEADGTDLVQVSAAEYDNGLAGGMSNVTKSTQFVDASTCRETDYAYDFRQRQIIVDGEETNYRILTYDNLDRQTQIDQYDTTASGNLIARSEQFYDDRNRVYQTKRYAVDPSDGSVGNALTGNNTYDEAGNLIEATAPGQGVVTTYTTYDNVGRVSLTETGYDDAGATNGRVVVESSETTYDAANNATESVMNQLDAGATITSQTYRTSYQYTWFDGIGRTVGGANYGALGTAPTRSNTTPAASDTVLVNLTAYNDRGEADVLTDPMGRETRMTFDDLGRQTQTIENYTGSGTPSSPNADDNRTTQTAYAPDGQVTTLTAVMANSADNQVTTYTYGTTLSDSALASNGLLVETVYPDGTQGTDSVRMTYNRQGQVAQRVDQAGTTHVYAYDGLGRLRHDYVTAFGTNIDERVKRLTTQYEVRGMPSVLSTCMTALPNQTASGGGVINQVALQYNAFGQLIKDTQCHAGVAVTSGGSADAAVEYAYADGSGDSNQIRPTSVTYPNGKTLSSQYSSIGGINDQLNRVADIETTGTLAEYTYLGLSTTVKTILPNGDNLTLDHWGGTVGTYTGLDRFNRISNHPWATDTSTMAEFNYGYDRNSNRLWREDVAAGSNDFDELYTIDGLNRLVDMQRGQLNTAKDAIQAGTLDFQQDWGLDPVGNWDSFDVDSDGNGTDDLAQTRTHNKANEITGISQTAGPTGGWQAPGYDAAGNTTLMPQIAGEGVGNAGDPTQRYDGTYDAWNRLVKLTAPILTYDGRVGEYEYDARHFRIRRREYSAAGKFVSAYDDYYTSRWQRIETRSTTDTNAIATDVLAQWVWHGSADAYVDALCLRERDTTGNGTLNETFYACTDAMFNVVALVDGVSYIVEERYAYEPYGIASVLEPNWTARSTSDYDWGTRFQGLSTDLESGLIYQRKRINHPGLGRFMQRDPLGYMDGQNLYQLVASDPTKHVDPSGEVIPQIVVGATCLACFDATRVFLEAAHEACKDSPDAGSYSTCLLLRMGEMEEMLDWYSLVVINAACICCGGGLSGAVKKFAKEMGEKWARERAEDIAECEGIHQAYKALGCTGCRRSVTVEQCDRNIACLQAEIAGRGAYLAKKCDDILPGSIARGSARAERGHREQLASKTNALTRCIARRTALAAAE